MDLDLPEIIGIVGSIRSGKSTVAKYLVDRYEYLPASNSDVLKKILLGMGQAPTRVNLASLGDSLFSALGNDAIARFRLDNLHLGRIVVDGIRYPEEVKRYSEVSSFKLLAVTSDLSLRFQRALHSQNKIKDTNISQFEFESLDETRSEINVPTLVKRADFLISNLGSINELEVNVDRAIKTFQRLDLIKDFT